MADWLVEWYGQGELSYNARGDPVLRGGDFHPCVWATSNHLSAGSYDLSSCLPLDCLSTSDCELSVLVSSVCANREPGEVVIICLYISRRGFFVLEPWRVDQAERRWLFLRFHPTTAHDEPENEMFVQVTGLNFVSEGEIGEFGIEFHVILCSTSVFPSLDCLNIVNGILLCRYYGWTKCIHDKAKVLSKGRWDYGIHHSLLYRYAIYSNSEHFDELVLLQAQSPSWCVAKKRLLFQSQVFPCPYVFKVAKRKRLKCLPGYRKFLPFHGKFSPRHGILFAGDGSSSALSCHGSRLFSSSDGHAT